MPTTEREIRRPSRITETWLLHFIEHPDQVLWPEVRSMAKELLERRRKDHAERVAIRSNWERLAADIARLPELIVPAV
jgi:hypothetical protein